MTSSDDEDWQQYIKTVKPLKTPLKDQNFHCTPVKKIKSLPRNSSCTLPFVLSSKSYENELLSHFTIEKFNKKLQKSAIDATLDLHGEIIKDAYPLLVRFIEKAVYRGHRILLIITGKSLKKISTDNPRLVEQVPFWLKSAPLNQYVKKVTYARQEHGGDGAYYVFLKLS